jgi:uncharacterized membrane protein YheB (UPF0754 family)
MTPGVIPSKRHKLAVNIGEMVGEHLLTSKDISAAISEKRFQDHLYRLVDNRVNTLLSRDLGSIRTLVPKRFESYFKVAIRTLKYRLRGGIGNYLNSEEFAGHVTVALHDQLEAFGARELNQLVSSQERLKIYDTVDAFIAALLQGPQLEEWLTGYLRKSLQTSADEGRCVEELLPNTLLDLVDSTIRKRTPSLLQSLAALLAEPEIRERVVVTLRNGIEGFVASLGPVAAMVSSFLDMKILEEKIREYLKEKDADIVAWLQNPVVQEKMSDVLIEQADKFLKSPVADLLEKANDDTVQSICHETAIQILGTLRSQGVQSALSEMCRQNLEYMFANGTKTVKEVVEEFLHPLAGASLKNTIQEETLSMLRSVQVGKMLGKMLNVIVDGLQNQPVGVLRDVMPAGVRKGITEYIVATANAMLLDEVPGVIESLNIRQTVTDKVNSLDLKKLERLLLSIMEEQFKYINLFGALLGFLIGLLNLFIVQLG